MRFLFCIPGRKGRNSAKKIIFFIMSLSVVKILNQAELRGNLLKINVIFSKIYMLHNYHNVAFMFWVRLCKI